MIETLIAKSTLPIRSRLITLQDVAKENAFYSVPLYQRLYVWGERQVTTLLEDLERAAFEDLTQNESGLSKRYFLGGIMVSENREPDEASYDLIDGQQRFTTLWIISHVLKQELEAFTFGIQAQERKSRVSFAIREFANRYFANPDSTQKFGVDEEKQLENISSAQKTIQNFLDRQDLKVSKQEFASFVFSKVAFIQTKMPAGIDENQLFEVLNNRGRQLQHHEILKSKLLEPLPEADRQKYGQLWEACSIMDEYIEKNIKEIAGLTWGAITTPGNDDEEAHEIGLPADMLNRLSTPAEPMQKTHLLELMEDTYTEEKEKEEVFQYDSGKVRSILSFEMLLLHVLRIFLFKEKSGEAEVPEVNEKKLIQIFEEHFFESHLNESGVRNFIELLWKLRISFDKHIIKWVERDANLEIHAIKRLYQNKKVLQRRELDNNEGFALLQSMLYHSQQIITLYWLTPFLYKTLEEDDKNALYKYLQKLDNAMFCSSRVNEELSLRSWNLIGNDLNETDCNAEELNTAQGTGFRSYWFYKNEFILWYLQAEEKGEDWKAYRMTKKNSVEHIMPQTDRGYGDNQLWKEEEDLTPEKKKARLDDYGNLVLLSVGMNSEYSNKTFGEKRTTFIEKKRLDSLKSACIFSNDTWSWGKCKAHRQEMINLFNDYFRKTR